MMLQLCSTRPGVTKVRVQSRLRECVIVVRYRAVSFGRFVATDDCGITDQDKSGYQMIVCQFNFVLPIEPQSLMKMTRQVIVENGGTVMGICLDQSHGAVTGKHRWSANSSLIHDQYCSRESPGGFV